MPVEMAGAVGLDLVGGGQTIFRQVAALHCNITAWWRCEVVVCAARKIFFTKSSLVETGSCSIGRRINFCSWGGPRSCISASFSRWSGRRD